MALQHVINSCVLFGPTNTSHHDNDDEEDLDFDDEVLFVAVDDVGNWIPKSLAAK